jgi:DNA-binding MarR family transcriptional regulator
MHSGDVDDLIALAHALVDLVNRDRNGLSSTSIAALIAIRRDEPLSIGAIAEIVGLTHSATVRLVDRLEKDWLVRRGRRTGREVMVETTARGKRRVTALKEAMHGSLEHLLERLPGETRQSLAEGAAALLGLLIEDGQDDRRLYRYGGGERSR